MSKRQKSNSRLFVPPMHIEHCVYQAAVARFPDFENGLRTRLSTRTIDRLEGTLRTLVSLCRDGQIVGASQKYIGALRGKSDRALRLDLRDLEALGLVETVQNYDKLNRRLHNNYRLAPVLYLWRKGKQQAQAARKAIVAIAEGLTSRLVRRVNNLHKAFRDRAQENLKRGACASDIQRNIPAELPSSFKKEGKDLNKQMPSASGTSRSAKVLELVRLFGVEQAAKMSRIPAVQVKELWLANNQGH